MANQTHAGSNSSASGIDAALLAFVDTPLAISIAFASSTVAFVLAMWNIYKHLTVYTSPNLQRQIIRILLTVPVYSLFSFAMLVFPDAHLYLASVRDVWESFVIHSFMSLILFYGGGEAACLSVIMNDPGSIQHPFPLNLCLPDMALDARFLRVCKRFTLQFVILKPMLAVVNLIVMAVGHYEDAGYVLFVMITYNLSYSIALYGLVLFYLAMHAHPGLKHRHPLAKFASVKTLVFLTYYQSLFMPEQFNAFVLCCEMFLFALLHVWAFPWREFKAGMVRSAAVGDSSSPGWGVATEDQEPVDAQGLSLNGMESVAGIPPQASGKAHSQALAQTTAIPAAAQQSGAFTNARDAMSFKDVQKDVFINFGGNYGGHVLLQSESEVAMADSAGMDVDDDDLEEIAVSDTAPGHAVSTSSGSSKGKSYKDRTFIAGDLHEHSMHGDADVGLSSADMAAAAMREGGAVNPFQAFSTTTEEAPKFALGPGRAPASESGADQADNPFHSGAPPP